MRMPETGFEATLFIGYDKPDGEPAALVIMRPNGDKIELLKAEFGEQADILYRLLTEQETKAEIKMSLQDFIDELWKRKKSGSPNTSPVCADIIDILQEGSEGSDADKL